VVRHREVHQDHVHLALAHDVQGLAAVARFAGDAQVRLLGQELAQSGAHDGMVVDDRYADHEDPSVNDSNRQSSEDRAKPP
jgi:hypothetical protein